MMWVNMVHSDFLTQLKETVQTFVCFSIALDSSADDTFQLNLYKVWIAIAVALATGEDFYEIYSWRISAMPATVGWPQVDH
jgi:hypothetical protein